MQFDGVILLDVVVGDGPPLIQLLTDEQQIKHVKGDADLVRDLGLHVLDSIRGLDLECGDDPTAV